MVSNITLKSPPQLVAILRASGAMLSLHDSCSTRQDEDADASAGGGVNVDAGSQRRWHSVVSCAGTAVGAARVVMVS
jgi:hypothetical protein